MEDLFHASLNLEDRFHAEGYKEGAAVGARQGLIEGRIYGAEQAYERFRQVGYLYAKLSLWRAHAANADAPARPKLEKALDRLATLLTAIPRHNNTMPAGADFEAVLAGCIAKAKVIASLMGERTSFAQQDLVFGDAATGAQDVEEGAEGAALVRGGPRRGCAA